MYDFIINIKNINIRSRSATVFWQCAIKTIIRVEAYVLPFTATGRNGERFV